MSNSNPPLGHLLARCALGDRHALKELYDTTAAQLFGLVLGIGTQREWAQEILQEGFLKIWRYADQYREDKGAPMTWMSGVVRHCAIDWLRRYRPHSTESLSADEWEALHSDEPQHEDFFAAQQEYELLRLCMDALEPQQAEAIKMAYYQGLTHDSLAKQLGKPLGTVKSWIRRGLTALKKCLSP